MMVSDEHTVIITFDYRLYCTSIRNTVQRISGAVLQVLLPLMNDVKEDLALVRRDLNYLNKTTSELADLYMSLQSATNATSQQLTHLCDKTSTLDSKLTSVNALISENFSSLESQVHAMINPLNITLESVDTTTTMMSDDLRCLKKDLNSLNDSAIEQNICLEEHKNEVTSELANLNAALSSVSALICDKFGFVEDNMTNKQVSLDGQLQNIYKKFCRCLPIHTCGGTGGWRQVVNLDMTDNRTECPEGWNMTDYSKRTCGRASEGESLYASSCDSVTYPVCEGEYSQVCGRIKAYQWGWTGGFGRSSPSATENDAYFSGVAVMHGSPRQHIWTFVAGAAENYVIPNTGLCPCDVYFAGSVPPFVGEDYFCESGIDDPLNTSWFSFHSDDILWDGKDCHSSSTCCSLHDPPFFTKTLSTPTTDELELRMCLYQSIARMNIAVELIKLYVK